MDYSLAKQLKEAGYPIRENFPGYEKGTNAEIDKFLETHYAFEMPTLSELIEACGEYFGNLGKYKYESGDGTQDWLATSQLGVPLDKRVKGEGATPEEAVARLWLALHPVKV